MQDQPKRRGRRRRRPQWPAWRVALMDFLLTVLCLGIFFLLDLKVPRAYQTVDDYARGTPAPDALDEPASSAAPGEAPEFADFSAKFADKFTDGEPIQTQDSYVGRNIRVELTSESLPELTYHVQHIYVRSVEYLRTAFAKDIFGKSITEPVLTMADRNRAVGAINSDYYGYGSDGIVIRNGVLYRDIFTPNEPVLVLNKDGVMKVYDGAYFDAQAAMEDGAWQSWSFGPDLVASGGGRYDSYEQVNRAPRTVIGMVEPGHYLFIVVDGRQGDYSLGLNYSELANLCISLGCQVAYNLDGGKTSQMTFLNAVVGRPYEGGRDTSDIVYVADAP